MSIITRNESISSPFTPAMNRLHAAFPGVGFVFLFSRCVNKILDVNVFKNSVSKLIEKHEILRSTSDVVDGQNMLIRHSVGKISVKTFTDLEKEGVISINSNDHQGNIDQFSDYLNRNKSTSRELENVAFHLYFGLDGKTLVFLSGDNLFLDWLSLDLIFRNLLKIYDDEVLGIRKDLEALPIQFSDYAWWLSSDKKNVLRKQKAIEWVRNRVCGAEIVEFPWNVSMDTAKRDSISGTELYRRTNFLYRFNNHEENEINVFCKKNEITKDTFWNFCLCIWLAYIGKVDDVLYITGASCREALYNEIGLLLGHIASFSFVRKQINYNASVVNLCREIYAENIKSKTMFVELLDYEEVSSVLPPSNVQKEPVAFTYDTSSGDTGIVYNILIGDDFERGKFNIRKRLVTYGYPRIIIRATELEGTNFLHADVLGEDYREPIKHLSLLLEIASAAAKSNATVKDVLEGLECEAVITSKESK